MIVMAEPVWTWAEFFISGAGIGLGLALLSLFRDPT